MSAPIVPSIEVRFSHLRYSIKQSATTSHSTIPTVGSTLTKIATAPFRAVGAIAGKIRGRGAPVAAPPANSTFTILDDVSGVLRPGTLTLLLAPPGHGKSALLKALTQMLPAKELQGEVLYSGLSPAAAPAAGVHLGSLCQYVNQVDEHLAQLTVRETFDFVRDSCAINPADHGFPALAEAHKGAVDDILNLLHLNTCANTVIGNDLLRGVSGGEKKRVTVGEGLLTAARFLALDEISTGLDSAVTFDIIKRLRQRATDQGLTVICSLLQPTPETFDLFDEIMLLREGAVVYHGPRVDLPGYLRGLGYSPPSAASARAAVTAGASAPTAATSMLAGGDGGATDDVVSLDIADWLVQLLSSPEKLLAISGAAADDDDAEGVKASRESVPTTTAALAAAWRESSIAQSALKAPPAAPLLKLEGSFAVAQYSKGHAHSYATHLRLLLGRQLILMRRNLLYVRSRIMSACIMSVVLGGLYYQRSVAQGMTLYGTFLNCLMIMGFSNLSEMAAAVENKYIAYRHVSNGFFPPALYVLTSAITHVPVAVTEVFIFTGVIYGMSGMGPSAGGYFFLWGTVVLFNILMRNLLVLFALSGKSLQASQAAPLPIIALMIIFGGFLITRDKMGWLTFMSYIDPINWALRSLAINEFTSSKYQSVVLPWAAFKLKGFTRECSNVGDCFLTAYDIPTDTAWQWGGIGFLIGSIILILIRGFRVFGAVRFDRNIGSARTVNTVGLKASSSSGTLKPSASAGVLPRVGTSENDLALRAPVASVSEQKTVQKALPLTPMTVAFTDITYTVTLPKHLGGGEKTLLRGISGVARPGRILALMGASGAGKTTLLDVLAGRKNSGKMTGRVTLNGFDKEARTFNRVTAYCEQSDVHMPLATVREALDFSARLRLPADVTAQRREAFVDEVIGLLELTNEAGRLVGAPGAPEGLAPHERKRLTIGVELVSNAPVVFLDEPTSGLDSRAAAIVMRVIRRVASSGRTVICTVHQPSSEIFFAFHDILLLQRGGWLVYTGPLGAGSSTLVEYLSSLPRMQPPPAGMNPASWMLDALQGLDSTNASTELTNSGERGTVSSTVLVGDETQTAFFKSAAGASALADIADAATPKAGAERVSFPSRYAVSFLSQAGALFRRHFTSYWRNIGLNVGRLMALTMLNLLFGTIWYQIRNKSDDLSGIQSLIACIFMSCAFGAMINMNTSVPGLISVRAVFYREQNGNFYDSFAYSLALLFTELPYLAAIMLTSTSVGYFMFGLRPEAGAFFFHALISYTLAVVYISIGQCVSSLVPTFEVAQAVLGILGPLFFLFGGLWSPPSQMADGASWFCVIDPITYAFRAIIPQQFIDAGTALIGTQTKYEYVSSKYVVYDGNDAWNALGYLAIFIAVFQTGAFLGMRYVRHIVR